MKRHIIAVSLMMGLLAAGVLVVSAQCDTTGTPADDTITCTGTSAPVDGAAGNDTIIINGTGTVTGSVMGGAGEDTITVDGTVNSIVYGDTNGVNVAADDTIIINGTVGAVAGDSSSGSVSAGNDTIIINGTVTGNITGDFFGTTNGIPGGNDTVILRDGANGGADNLLNIYGIVGTDTLVFELTMNTDADYQAISALIAAANPDNGSITINGQTYVFGMFEILVNDLIQGYIAVPPGMPVVITLPLPDTTAPAAPAEPSDGRINWEHRGFAPVAIYCRENSVQVYNPAGQMIFMSSADAINAAFAASADVNQPVNSAAGFSLWTLNRTHELQVHADAGGYDFIFPARCVG